MGYFYIATGAAGLLAVLAWWVHDLHADRREPEPQTFAQPFDQAVPIFAAATAARTGEPTRGVPVTAELRPGTAAVTADLSDRTEKL